MNFKIGVAGFVLLGRALSAAPQLADSAAAPGGSTRPPVGAPAAAAPRTTAARPPVPNPMSEYRIGAGDILQISVWKEPELSVASVVVRPDGRITVPLLKEIDVAGFTPTEVEKTLTEGFSTIIPSGADVTVVVSGINSKKIYIIGAVKKEGPIQYTYRMTIMQALSEAGGLTDYARRKKIYVLRAEKGRQTRLPFNYDAVLKGERMEENILLLPNDTLVVPH